MARPLPERPVGRRRRISVDASYRDGFAGLAAVLEDRDARVLFIDVAAVGSAFRGEQLALGKAMEIAERAGWTQVVFLTDVRGMNVGRKLLPGWRVEWVPRGSNTAAHTVASEGLKLWEAGREGRPTTPGTRAL